ncbi:agmatinase family protein [Microbacterium lacus]|uniref:agmatinase family protein n=1 Tax=Microbacterium lacus TaxID=415217 RepID=UPI00384A99E9
MTSHASSRNFAAITSGVLSVLGAPHVPPSELKEFGAKAAFLGFPFDGANAAIERPGSANGPRGLRIASNMCFPWSFEWDIDLFEAYNLVDCGDSPIAIGNAVRTHELVQAEIATILAAGTIPMIIGGDHSVCVPGTRALSEYLGPEKKMGYLHLDAHLDAGEEIGGEYETNCSGLVRAADLPNVSKENVVAIGARGTINVPDWWEAVKRREISVYTMRDIRSRPFEEVVGEALDRAWDGVDGVYVSFDTDVIDSAYAPGTTGPEPGGFTGPEIIRMGQMIGERGISAVDNVELCPIYDPSGITARLVWEVLSQMLYANAKRSTVAQAAEPA